DVGRGSDNVFWVRGFDGQEHPALKNPTEHDLMAITKPPHLAAKDEWKHSRLRFITSPEGHSYVFPAHSLIHDQVARVLKDAKEPGMEDYQYNDDYGHGNDYRTGELYRVGPREWHSDELEDPTSIMKRATRAKRARGGHIRKPHAPHLHKPHSPKVFTGA